MNKIVTQIANLITSLGMVVFVLLMTVVAMIFVGHGLYYEVFIKCMLPWQAEVASWVLSFGVETTVLVITCNVKYFSSNKLPLFFAVCSGFIVLFFINAFDVDQSKMDMAIRLFIGLLVVGVNYVYSELFVKKLNDEKQTIDLTQKMEILQHQNEEQNELLVATQSDLMKSKQEVERLMDYTKELEVFKKKEIEKLTCRFCKATFQTIFHLNSHIRNCNHNQK